MSHRSRLRAEGRIISRRKAEGKEREWKEPPREGTSQPLPLSVGTVMQLQKQKAYLNFSAQPPILCSKQIRAIQQDHEKASFPATCDRPIDA